MPLLYHNGTLSICSDVIAFIKWYAISTRVKGVHFTSDDEEASLEYFYSIGLGHAKRGKPRDAIFYFNMVLAVNPTHLNALINKANALGKIGRYNEAISFYDMALNLKPNHVICLLNKGLALHYLQRYDEAITCYDKILSQEPEHASTLYHKACSKTLQKNTEEALVLLERAIVLEPEFAIKASGDKDFDILRSDDRFKALIT